MPNHIHGILQIINNVGAYQHTPSTQKINSDNPACISDNPACISDNPACISDNPACISDNGRAYVDTPLQICKSPSKTIGSVIRGFKIGVTKWYRQNCTDGYHDTLWQRNYYEHIIRDEQSYKNILDYIEQNPMRWDVDGFS